MARPNISALVLAAGKSRRFGEDKRLFVLPGKARNLLQLSVAGMLAQGIAVTVVLSDEDRKIVSGLLGELGSHKGLNIMHVIGAGPAGMGLSLSQGIVALPDFVDAVLISLADMPYIRASTIAAVIGCYSEDKIIVPCFIGRRGHPVLISRKYFADLKKLRFDEGGRSVLSVHQHAVVELEVDDPGILLDIDLKEDILNKV